MPRSKLAYSLSSGLRQDASDQRTKTLQIEKRKRQRRRRTARDSGGIDADPRGKRSALPRRRRRANGPDDAPLLDAGLLIEEVAEADGTPVKAKVLGEDLWCSATPTAASA